jgi:hypothetical protein
LTYEPKLDLMFDSHVVAADYLCGRQYTGWGEMRPTL